MAIITSVSVPVHFYNLLHQSKLCCSWRILKKSYLGLNEQLHDWTQTSFDISTLIWFPGWKRQIMRKGKGRDFGVIVKFNLSVDFWKLNCCKSFPYNFHNAHTLLKAPLIKSSLLPTQFTWHLYSGTVIISTTCCWDESASPLAGSNPAALEDWRVKHVRLGCWLELREAERKLREKREH